jgi:hypothetical protein
MHLFLPSGMFKALMKGKAKHGSSWLPKRRARHVTSQMRFFSSGKYQKSADDALWKFSNKKRDDSWPY